MWRLRVGPMELEMQVQASTLDIGTIEGRLISLENSVQTLLETGLKGRVAGRDFQIDTLRKSALIGVS